MPVSAESDLVFSWSLAAFHSSLPLRRWEKLASRNTSETQNDHLTVKTTEKEKQICVTFRTVNSTCVAMRFFRNAARSTSKWSLLGAVVTSVALRFFRNAARSTSKTSFLRAVIASAAMRFFRNAARSTSKWSLLGAVVTSVALRFFRNAARSTSKNELLESSRNQCCLAFLQERSQKYF